LSSLLFKGRAGVGMGLFQHAGTHPPQQQIKSIYHRGHRDHREMLKSRPLLQGVAFKKLLVFLCVLCALCGEKLFRFFRWGGDKFISDR
jgi:hypothetical protein